MITAITEDRKKEGTEMNIDFNRTGREFITKILKENSKKFNRIMGEARRIVFVEGVIKETLNAYLKTGNAQYEITAEDSIDGTKTVINIRKEYIFSTQKKSAA